MTCDLLDGPISIHVVDCVNLNHLEILVKTYLALSSLLVLGIGTAAVHGCTDNSSGKGSGGDDDDTTADSGSTTSWTGAVTVTTTGGGAVGGTSYASSSKLLVSWPAATGVDHFEITATESVGGSTTLATASGTELSATLTELKASTAYAVSVVACSDASCSTSITGTSASGTTPGETWVLQGTGHTHATLTKVVPDGNSKIHAAWFGAGAGAQSNKVQLYYGPLGMTVKGLAVGTMSGTSDATNPSSVLSFTSTAGTYGLVRPSSASTLVGEVNTGEGVPLTTSKVRLFFEATGADGKSRVMHLDSQDGYTGLDFNSDSPTVCSSTAEYGSGGGCEPTLDIGVKTDTDASTRGWSGVENARQFKLGYPKMTNWAWDASAGTFMVFTVNRTSACGTDTSTTQAFAVYDGTHWNVDTASGCPRVFENAQAPMPLHIGGVRYKMYFGDPSDTTGRVDSGLPWLGPKKFIYADGSKNGSATLVEYDDFEARASARTMTFLWPDGTAMSETEAGYIDDFTMTTPTNSLDFQVMYMAITDSVTPPFSAGAILVNP